MNKFLLCMLSASVIGFGSVASAQSFKRIKKEADFRKVVVDKKLTADGSWMTIKSDGKTAGVILKKKFAAAWVWQNGMYCRNAVMGNKKLGTDCQVVKISGKTVQFIREYGKGPTGEMQLP